jgi:hypothetical protein
MAGSTFKTNPYYLNELLENCHRGIMQLPDFQRSWVWDEDRIKSLIASVSRAFPVGALMSLDTGGEVNFKPRPVEGAPTEAKQMSPHSLLLDGQQRMTSLYQVALRGKVVETVTPKKKKVKRWFYIDILKALDPSVYKGTLVLSELLYNKRTVLAQSGKTVQEVLAIFPVSEYFRPLYPPTHDVMKGPRRVHPWLSWHNLY